MLCKVLDTSTELSLYTSAQIIAHPDEQVETNTGGNIALTCVASGNPVPHINWSRNGSTLNTVNNSSRIAVYEKLRVQGGVVLVTSILEICSTEEEDSGWFSCEAYSEKGIHSDTYTFSLSITPSMSPEFITLTEMIACFIAFLQQGLSTLL